MPQQEQHKHPHNCEFSQVKVTLMLKLSDPNKTPLYILTHISVGYTVKDNKT